MATLAEQAEFFRVAFAVNIVSRDDIITWADSVISQCANPPIEIIHVADAGSVSQLDMIGLLGRVKGSGDLAKGGRMVLALVHQKVRDGILSLNVACKTLYAFTHWASASDDEKFQAMSFDDLLFCAMQGYMGTPKLAIDGVRKDMEEFLLKYRQLEAELPAPSFSADKQSLE